MFTKQLTKNSSVLQNGAPFLPGYGGLSLHGTIRCSKCGRKMDSAYCAACGYHQCYIDIYWNKKHHIIRRHRETNLIFIYELAQRQLTLMRADIDRKVFTPEDWKPQKIKERKFENKVWDWLADKEQEMEDGERKPETIRTYRSYINNHFIEFFKGWDMREIEYEQIKGFKTFLAERVNISTRKRIMGALHAFFKWAKREKVINVMPDFPVVEGDGVSTKVAIEAEDQDEGLQRIPAEHRDPVAFGMEVGLRPNETCALRPIDILVGKKCALICRGYSGSVLIETTKENSKDYVPLSEKALEIALRNMQGKHPHDFLFKNPNTGRGYTVKTLSKYWRKFSGIDVTYYEASRHSYCSQIVEDPDVNEFKAQALMRHKDPRSTRRYIHADVTKYRDIVNRRGKVVPIQKTETDPKRGSEGQN